MKCPNCNQEIQDDAKFCTVCGTNIEEAIKTKEREEEERLEKEAKRKKEIEDKKRLEELRKQEQERLIKEAEKAEAIRQAKEEGIELEIIDEEPEEPEVSKAPEENKSEFKIKREKEASSEKRNKKRKVIIKKNIFQVIFEKLLFIIITAAIIIGAIYFCYRKNYLPDFAMEKAEEIDLTIQNIINMQKDIEEIEDGKTPSKNKAEYEWQVEPSIEADDIKDLTDEYSIIIKKNLYGIINNKDGKIVLEPKYSLIEFTEYKIGEVISKGIVVKENEKFYKLNDKFELDGEVVKTQITNDEGAYFFDHHDSIVYYNNAEQLCKKANEKSAKRIEICTDISIVTKDGKDAKNEQLPETFTIDFEKSTLGPKGYCNPEKGELIIDCNYKEALDFSEGYAAVKEDEKAGFINEKGEKWHDLTFEEARSVHNKMAFVKENGKWGILKLN